jgi:hypothetical protein
MISLLILFATFCALVVVFVRPKWGSFLIWSVLFTYPHNWWFQHSILPLNIGVDDLFCILLFGVVVIRRNLLGGIPVRLGYAFWTVTAFLVVGAIAILSGSMDAPGFERIYYIKDILKLCVYWGLFYAIIHCVDDRDDLRRQFTWFTVAAVLGGLIVILHGLFPGRMQAWSNPLLTDIEGITRRATGAFLNANSAACIMVCSLAMVITAIKLQDAWGSKAMITLFCTILLVGVLVTRSRSGLLTLAGILLLMACLGQNKRIAWMIILAGCVLGMLMVGMRQAVQQRVSIVYDAQSGTWGKNVTGRLDTWIDYFESATPKVFLLGQGHRGGIARNGAETHSAYVSTLTVYGLGGVIWALVMIGVFIRKVVQRQSCDDPLIGIIKAGCAWALLAWCVYGLSADALSSQYTRYLLFYLIVLLDRTSAIAKEESQWYDLDTTLESELAHTDKPSPDRAIESLF